MKKTAIICMAALLAMAASCKKEKNESVEVDFRATAESHVGNSKTHLEGQKIKWDEADAIRVFSGSNKALEGLKFTARDVDGQTAGFKSDEETPVGFYQKPYTAFYPYDGVRLQDSKYVLELPGTQTYAENSFATGANPMAAYENNDDMKLHFKNICGVLELRLKSAVSCKVNNITITSMADEKLWGEGTVTWDANNEPVLNIASGAKNGGNSVKLTCNNSVDLKDSPCFCFVLPANTLASGFKVTLKDDQGNVWEKKAYASEHNTIQRNGITKMPLLSVSIDPVGPPEGALPGGVFTVGMDSDGVPRKVYFSKGNLWLNNRDDNGGKRWDFEANQYDYRTYSLQNDTQEDTFGLFGWGDAPESGGIKTRDDIEYPWCEWGTRIGDGKWRTLTGLSGGEWEYLLKTRTVNGNTGEGYAYTNQMQYGVSIDGKNYKGLFIYPDGYTGNAVGESGANTWAEINTAGIVFLPAAGSRKGVFVHDAGADGCYWSSTGDGATGYFNFFYRNDEYDLYTSPTSTAGRHCGHAVRLVYPAN